MSRARVRRPLLALIALVLAVVIGYTVKALESTDSGPSRPHPTQSGPRQ